MKSIQYDAKSGVHRPTPPPIGFPALIRHLCLWEVAERTEAARVLAITNYIKQLAEIIRSSQAVTKIVDVEAVSVREHTRGQAVTFKFYWHHVFSTVRIHVHTEYISLESIIDFSIFPDGDEHVDQVQLLKTDPEYCYISTALKKFLVHAGNYNPERSSAFLYSRIWYKFFNSILDARETGTLGAVPSQPRPGRILQSKLGELLGDFRGVILGEPASSLRSAKINLSRPFRLKPHARGQNHNYLTPPSDWRSNRLRSLRAVLQVDQALAEYEFTASAFLDGRVLYISALGPPQDPDAHAQSRRHGSAPPVCFVVNAALDDPWDIGRFIETITRLGTLRMSAVFQLDELHRANADLSTVGTKMRNLSSELLSLSSSVDLQSTISRDALPERIRALGTEFAEIRAQKLAIDKPFHRSLEYRLRRNLYYLNSFRRLLPLTSEQPVDGFQQYSAFVQRRLGESFEYMGTLTSKLAEVSRDEGDLAEAHAQLQMMNLTVEIRTIGDATRSNTEAIQTEEDDIQQIQAFGEDVLILVLVPYYLSHIIEGILVPLTRLVAKDVDPIVVGFSWFLGAAFGGMIYRHHLFRVNAKMGEKLKKLTDLPELQQPLTRIANLKSRISRNQRIARNARRWAAGVVAAGFVVALISLGVDPQSYDALTLNHLDEIETSLGGIKRDTQQLLQQSKLLALRHPELVQRQTSESPSK